MTWRILLATIVSLLVPPELGRGMLWAQATNAPLATTRTEILAALDSRSTAIKSVRLELSVEEQFQGKPPKPRREGDPFDEVAPLRDGTLFGNGEFEFEDGKIALAWAGSVADPEIPGAFRPQRVEASYDGHEGRVFAAEALYLPMGSIAVTTKAPQRITTDAKFLGAALWLYPRAALTDAGWAIDRLRLESDGVAVGETKCVRLVIPRRGSQQTSTLDVDPANGYAAVQWQTWLGKKISMRVAVSYEERPGLGIVPREWTVKFFDGRGEVESSYHSRVTESVYNGDIDDSHFQLRFPVGTHVTSEGNGKTEFFIQLEDGLRPLSREQCGKMR